LSRLPFGKRLTFELFNATISRCAFRQFAGADGNPPGLPMTAAASPTKKDIHLQVLVRDNNIEQALRVLKKKMQHEGCFAKCDNGGPMKNLPSAKPGKSLKRSAPRASSRARRHSARGLIADPRKKKLLDAKTRPQAFRGNSSARGSSALRVFFVSIAAARAHSADGECGHQLFLLGASFSNGGRNRARHIGLAIAAAPR
jgi:small subunit ribosomal protein S21